MKCRLSGFLYACPPFTAEGGCATFQTTPKPRILPIHSCLFSIHLLTLPS